MFLNKSTIKYIEKFKKKKKSGFQRLIGSIYS